MASSSHCVNEFSGIDGSTPTIFIGVVRSFQDGAALAEVVDGDSDEIQVKVIATILTSLMQIL